MKNEPSEIIGFLPLVFLLALPITYLLLKIGLNRYNRSLRASMRTDSGESLDDILTSSKTATLSLPNLDFVSLSDKDVLEPDVLKKVKQERRAHFLRLLAVYSAFFVLYSILMINVFTFNTAGEKIDVVPIPLQFVCYLFVPIYIYVSYLNLSLFRGILLLVIFLTASIIIFQLSDDESLMQYLYFIVLFPAALLSAF